MSGERESGKSVRAAQHDGNDDLPVKFQGHGNLVSFLYIRHNIWIEDSHWDDLILEL